MPPSCVSLPDAIVEHPVVAARVQPPHLHGVGEDEEPRAVGRPGVVGDGQAVLLAGRHQPRAVDQHPPLAGGGFVADDVGAAVGIALDDGVGRAVGQPARRAERRRIVGVILEDAAELRVDAPPGRAPARRRQRGGGDADAPRAARGRRQRDLPSAGPSCSCLGPPGYRDVGALDRLEPDDRRRLAVLVLGHQIDEPVGALAQVADAADARQQRLA